MLSPHELIAQCDHVPNDNERGGRDTGCSRPFGQRVQRAFYRFLMSPRSPLDDGSGRGVGAAVSVSGMIGFIGLVVPHLLRPWVGHEPGRLLVPSALGGASLALLADVLVRIIPTPVELKIGVLTALIGAPFFLSLLRSMRKELV